MKPTVGITMGDAAGIGPEIILKAFRTGDLYQLCRPLVLGSADTMEYYKKLFGIEVAINAANDPSEAEYKDGRLDILDLGLVDVANLKVGVVDPGPGKAAVVYTQEAGRLAMSGTIDAIVSAPLNKESMRQAGYHFEGQTQILAELTASRRYGMILLLGEVRVMMLTTHCSLREACDAVTKEKVLSMIELAHESLQTFGIAKPRIAVAGLNPHAGEGGLFGTEEVEGSIPAIKAAAAEGIDAVGPVPADVVFVKARDGQYDLVLAMFHDQANIAAKLLGFGQVVTVLAGLPIIRTSVGHGTAFDIAGEGIADEKNFVKSIEAAAELARMKKERD
ncbi:MAG: 4-hydroxythreonine-4-phosphate dehydrogenase PdxA [Phycisphaerae bacterium]|nr:4-hydroxythreonine-4-phosphate dehydrogenase PdxA [Phycisphaerae bacterium]MDP7637138.1 4-hydroxythreonine-4-phosphate dehydrogenase PdxA [Phycisphaerae bacterium]